VFAFTTSSKVTGWDVFAVSRRLRERGWQVPAYAFPEHREDLTVLRVV
jgi:glutamate decarboxylase